MAAPLTVLTIPNPLLRQPSAPVDAATIARLTREGFFDALIATMRLEDGVGIAAPQVGIPLRVIVVLEGRTPRVYCNPVVTTQSTKTKIDTEGCLSVPNIIGIVTRAKNVSIRALDIRGKPVERRARDLTARIFQHEVDHLDGILFIDRAIRTSTLPAGLVANLRV